MGHRMAISMSQNFQRVDSDGASLVFHGALDDELMVL